MKELLELNQIVYSILKTQIQFGTYDYDEHLPTIEEMAKLLFVSVDTIQLAYRQLQKEGYITLSKSIGTVVKVHYNEQEIEQNIQTFFSEHKDILLDLYSSIPLLFSNIQLMAWKNILLEDLYKINDNFIKKQVHPSYLVIFYLQILYGSLKNDLLIRLIHKLNIIYMVPFLSLKNCEKYIQHLIASFPYKIKLYCQKDWVKIQALINNTMKEYFLFIDNFYKTTITVPDAKLQIAFTWSSHKKASQICYSVGLEILSLIVRGNYPVGSFLPSLKNLADEHQVSISTIRHTLALLNDLGIVKTINGIGTQILSVDQIAENCNLSSLTMRKRLLDCKQSLQIFALSCRDIAKFTIYSIDSNSKAQWIEQLYLFEHLGKLDLISTFSLKFISQVAPYQIIRTIYAELYKQLFWGIPLRGMMGTQETVNTFYLPYHHDMVNCLKKSDAERFAEKLEEILYHEFKFVSEQLAKFEI